ncbi:MucR family transcriptional regulator [Aestuariivirga sp.]|jgi:predicted transcriptional regulator|uniref:MucR family transcriptional regulator n=1 Tax=Aestuariivirga sp. TaxID=2650926 RepID=UPI0037838E0A
MTDANPPAAEPRPTLIELASQIVAAYVARNSVEQADVPKLIAEVHRALAEAAATGPGSARDGEGSKPQVNIRKTITPDYLICLEDGKKFKSLKRHLRTHFKLSPEQYREKWGLPPDYPMVAPNYANSRSQLAKTMGLGRRRGK